MEAPDLLDQVGLAGDVTGAPGRGRNRERVADLEAEPLEDPPLLGAGDLEAEQRVGARRPEIDPRALGEVALDVDVARPAGAGELDEEPRC